MREQILKEIGVYYLVDPVLNPEGEPRFSDPLFFTALGGFMQYFCHNLICEEPYVHIGYPIWEGNTFLLGIFADSLLNATADLVHEFAPTDDCRVVKSLPLLIQL